MTSTTIRTMTTRGSRGNKLFPTGNKNCGMIISVEGTYSAAFCLPVKRPTYVSCAVPSTSRQTHRRGVLCLGISKMMKNPPSQKVLARWIGRRFGRLVVRNFDHYANNGNSAWNCECECGKTVVVISSNLVSGRTVSCGCYYREIRNKTNLKHGKASSRIYRVWRGILDRCDNPHNTQWSNYGGRGISVSLRWRDFQNFWDDMGDAPPGATIDRIDNNGNYEPDNCRWATPKEQSRNKRNNTYLEFLGRRMVIADWAKEIGVSDQMLRQRLNNGWTTEEALATPKHQRPPRLKEHRRRERRLKRRRMKRMGLDDDSGG